MVTAESTSTLEALIKQRILDQAFDDVEAKVAIEVKAKKQRQDVSDERSKAGLGDIYEQDYVKEALGVQPTDQLSEEKQEMAKLFQLLTAKLDALTNYHFAPKPLALQDDLQVKSNLAALKMEEVTPAAVSDATLLAPEEVFNKKKAAVVSKSEMSKAEKNAKRAAKKGSYKKREAQRDAERKAIVRLVPAAGEKDAKKKAEEQLKGKSKAARGGIEKANEVAVRAHYYYCFPPPPPPPSTLLAAAAAATAIIMIIIARLDTYRCGVVWYGMVDGADERRNICFTAVSEGLKNSNQLYAE